jgi:hypothetical protein
MAFGKTAKQETVVAKKGSPPVDEVRAGLVKATVWENKSTDGKPFRTISLQRSYKEKDSDQWKNTESYRISDIPRLILVLQQVYEKNVLSSDED